MILGQWICGRQEIDQRHSVGVIAEFILGIGIHWEFIADNERLAIAVKYEITIDAEFLCNQFAVLVLLV